MMRLRADGTNRPYLPLDPRVKRPSATVIEENKKKLSKIIWRCSRVHLEEKTNDKRVQRAITLLIEARKHLKHQRLRALKRSYYLKQKSLISAQRREKYLQMRFDVLSHYSPALTYQRCGIKDYRVLSIDHTKSHGAKQRERRSFHLYTWLRRHHYPPGYQVLCNNCQRIKMAENHEYSDGNYTALVPPLTFLEGITQNKEPEENHERILIWPRPLDQHERALIGFARVLSPKWTGV